MPRQGRGGVLRSWIMGVIGAGCLVAAVIVFKAKQSDGTGGTSPAPAPADEPLVQAPPRKHDEVVFLQACPASFCFPHHGIIARELLRQAFLIAARDEMGLQTRDESLREWRQSSPPDDTMVMVFDNDTVSVRDAPVLNTRWRTSYANGRWTGDLTSMTEDAEALSRSGLVDALRDDGWNGTANTLKPDAPAPDGAESLLGQMDELSQFSAIRLAHTAIRSDGESNQRLGVLVRGYANLGELCRYHWSTEFAVYTARSLLYAQRMVQRDPESPFALWHRAYARAMAGLPKAAVEDLKSANAEAGATPPGWVALIEPFCEYQPGMLIQLAANDSRERSLAAFLAFLAVEQSTSQAAVMNIAEAAMVPNPTCLRIIGTMCDETGPGMLNELSEVGPQVFSRLLATKLEQSPGLSAPIFAAIQAAKRPGGNPLGHEGVCQQLIERGEWRSDKGEPSWAALGRMIQEITFVHIERKANLISEQWGVDASDYANEVQPLIADHPFKFVINIYGARHLDDPNKARDALDEPPSTAAKMGYQEIQFHYLARQLYGESGASAVWAWMTLNQDQDAHDLEQRLRLYGTSLDPSAWVTQCLNQLRDVSPDSPMLLAAQIRTSWDSTKAPDWEKVHGDFPDVAMALGQRYSDMKWWTDAERCLRAYVSVSPDYNGYEALAQVYRGQGDTDKWRNALIEFLNQKQEYGLEHAHVDVQLAQNYMDSNDYKDAVPYAQSAADTGAGWGLEGAADAYTGLREWNTAEQDMVEEMNHYSTSPFKWYAWCVHTGHGALSSAGQAMVNYYESRGDQLSDEDLAQLGCFDMAVKKDADAMKAFQKRMELTPGPMTALHIAILADALHDSSARDAALQRASSIQGGSTSLAQMARILQSAVKAGPDALPNGKTLDDVITSASPEDRITICMVGSRFLENRGQTAAATALLNRCIHEKGDSTDRLVVDSTLRAQGLDPMEMDLGHASQPAMFVPPR